MKQSRLRYGVTMMDDLQTPLLTSVPIKNKTFFGIPWFSFENPWPTWRFPSLLTILRCIPDFIAKPRLPSRQLLDKKLPVETPDKNKLVCPPNESGIQFTWLGHASCLIQMEGVNILTDPITSQRCSFFQWFGPKRYTRTPLEVKNMPQIHGVVISHNHYDHLDLGTVKQLHERFERELTWFVPKRLKDWFTQCGINNVKELSWWESAELENDGRKVEIVSVPAQHWSNRFIHDRFKTLWGGWVMLGKHSRFYFAGDTGYCPAFKEIGQKYGPFTAAAIPIGAYCPRRMMHGQHIDPAEAVKVHKDVRSQRSIGIHWGTFDLSAEGVFEPRETLEKCAEEEGLPKEEFTTETHGRADIPLKAAIFLPSVSRRSVFSSAPLFGNPWSTWKGLPTLGNFLRFQSEKSKRPKQPNQQAIDIELPVETPDKDKLDNPPNEPGLQFTWLGHASCLIQIEGVNILADPITSQRCSPAQWLGPKRYTKVPLEVKDMPRIDAVIISHSHYDHLDTNTVKQLYKRFQNNLRWFVPRGQKSWFADLGITHVAEMSWWEEETVESPAGSATIGCVPAQHWANRALHDNFWTLWSGWVMLGKHSRFYFAGDTGYCPAFKEIGQKYGPFTAAAIPIGAYCPREMMQSMHVDPEEAVKVHQDVRSQCSIGVHWATFDLSAEGFFEPRDKLKECVAEAGLPEDSFTTVVHGRVLWIPTKPPGKCTATETVVKTHKKESSIRCAFVEEEI